MISCISIVVNLVRIAIYTTYIYYVYALCAEKKDANSTYRVPGGGSGGFVPLGFNRMVGQGPVHSPVSPNSFVLFTPPNPNPDGLVHVVVDPKLTSKLRPHQKEGVKFLWESVVGMRVEGKNGAIMADEMGLGKSLQVIR